MRGELEEGMKHYKYGGRCSIRIRHGRKHNVIICHCNVSQRNIYKTEKMEKWGYGLD